MEDGEDNKAGPLQCTYLADLSEETNAEYTANGSRRKRKQRSQSTAAAQKARRTRFQEKKAHIGEPSQARY